MQASAPLNLPTKIILKRLEKLTSPDMTLYNELGKANCENDDVSATVHIMERGYDFINLF